MVSKTGVREVGISIFPNTPLGVIVLVGTFHKEVTYSTQTPDVRSKYAQ